MNYVTGLRKGLPDLLIVLPEKCLIFIEMKRTKGSQTSLEQRQWIERLDSVPNVGAYICYGARQAIDLVQEVLNMEKLIENS